VRELLLKDHWLVWYILIKIVFTLWVSNNSLKKTQFEMLAVGTPNFVYFLKIMEFNNFSPFIQHF